MHQADATQEIIGQLRHYPLIHRVVLEYCSHGQAHLIPTPIVLPILASLSPAASLCGSFDESNGNEAQISSLAVHILSSTSNAIQVKSSLSVADFCSAFTYPNLRLEMIGVIYSIAARACSAGLSRDDDSHDDFVQNMYKASSDCRRIARDIAPLSDAMLWLTYESVILSSCIFGHSSKFYHHCIDILLISQARLSGLN